MHNMISSHRVACQRGDQGRDHFAGWRNSPEKIPIIFHLLIIGIAFSALLLATGPAQAQELRVRSSTLLSRQLAAESSNFLQRGKMDLAFLLAVEAYRQEDTWEARNSLLSALQSSPKMEKIIHPPEGFVHDILCKPDSILLILGSNDSSLVIWDALRGDAVGRPFFFDKGDNISATFSPDGNALAICTKDRPSHRTSIHIWDRSTGKIRRSKQLDGDDDSYSCPSFGPDGRIFAFFSQGSLVFWNLSSGDVSAEWIGWDACFWSNVALSPYGNMAAVGTEDGPILLFDVMSGRQIDAFPSQGERNDYALAFSPDGSVLAAGRHSPIHRLCGNVIEFWNVGTGEMVDSLPRWGRLNDDYSNGVGDLVYNPAGTVMASAIDSVVILWNLAGGRDEVLRGQGDHIGGIKFSPDGSRLISRSNKDITSRDSIKWSNTTVVWNVNRDDAIGDSLTGIGKDTYIGAMSPDAKRLVFRRNDRGIIVWDIDDARPVGNPLPPEWGDYMRFALNPGGTILAIESSDKTTITLWDTEKSAAIGAPLKSTCGFRGLAFSPDGSKLATGCRDGDILLWEVANQRVIGSPLRRTKGFVSDIVFSPDGMKLASNIEDSAIDIWDVSRDRVINEPLTIDSGSIRVMSFSPDGHMLAAGCTGGRIFLWDLSHKNAVRTLFKVLEAGYDVWGSSYTNITSILFSSDGSMIAVECETSHYEWSSYDLTLWDIHRGEMIGHPMGNYGTVMAFKPDGKTLAAADPDGRIHSWIIDVDYWAQRACKIANRNLSQREWIRYVGPEIPYDTICPGAWIPK